MARFDTDKDGKLSESEKAAAQEHRQKMMKKRFDKDGDGELNAEEQAAFDAASEKHKGFEKKMLEKFDGDGDGVLSKEERKAAHGARMAEHGDRKGNELKKCKDQCKGKGKHQKED
ncbi:MAG: hypothetical protein O3C57_08565, partial [Verrucomicrobia bacterium]|nr:hypothetical protein [Verrucomicrobiota bacterium]